MSSRTGGREIEMMARVAALYYLEDMTQERIARTLGLSRPKVSRLLQRARSEKIVEITVHVDPALGVRLEERLVDEFRLRQAFLVSDQLVEDAQRAAVASAAAAYLSRNLPDGAVVAVGMGRNVGEVPDQLVNPALRPGCKFVSAIGGSPEVAAPVNSNDISRRLAEHFGAKATGLYAPSYARTTAEHDAFMRHQDVRATLQLAKSARVALVGIGDAREDSAVVKMGSFSASEMDRLRKAGAIGDVLGIFFDIRGRPVVGGMESRVIALGASDLRRIDSVLAVASERSKANAILGALRTGMVDVLFTTIAIAREILTTVDEDRKAAAPRGRKRSPS